MLGRPSSGSDGQARSWMRSRFSAGQKRSATASSKQFTTACATSPTDRLFASAAARATRDRDALAEPQLGRDTSRWVASDRRIASDACRQVVSPSTEGIPTSRPAVPVRLTGQHGTTGTKYCSAHCAKATAQPESAAWLTGPAAQATAPAAEPEVATSECHGGNDTATSSDSAKLDIQARSSQRVANGPAPRSTPRPGATTTVPVARVRRSWSRVGRGDRLRGAAR